MRIRGAGIKSGGLPQGPAAASIGQWLNLQYATAVRT